MPLPAESPGTDRSTARADLTSTAPPPPESPWVVVGLGNPGPRYEDTRHNVGRLVVDRLVSRVGGRLGKHPSGRADTLAARLAGPGSPRLVLAVPRSYMNESGGPVAAVLRTAGSHSSRLIVVHDDLDLDFARLRVKLGGGDGGHNGLKSIRASVGTGDYLRVRVGIGRPPGRQDPADFVLSPFARAEQKELDTLLEIVADCIEHLITSGLESTQNLYHR